MATPNQIRIAELDYDQILGNLVDFMKTDPAFADYDFSGSGLRMLARILAYVTFYNNYYLTSVANEAFLDTAQLRSSVASHARMLGYNISGTKSARAIANVQVQLDNTSASLITLPKNTPFALIANTQYVFYNTSDTELTVNTTSGLYEGFNVQLVEGRPLQYQFTVDLTNPTQTFVVPNANVDYSTITVKVQASSTNNAETTFIRAENFLQIDANDPVFFVQESFNGYPELKFGNDVVGLALEHDNIVKVDYYVSRGEDGNSIKGPFRIPTSNVAGFVQGVTLTDGNTSPSSGGSDAESLDNARFLAPMVYQAQNRCVTADDYKAIILQYYGEHVGAINVFGGEQGDPNDPKERPIYGRVFIAVKPKIGLRFTDIIRHYIEQTIVQPRTVVGVIPQVIDPDYVYITVMTSVKYDPKATTRTKLQLQETIRTNVQEFALNNIEKFDTAFRFSKFVRIIDDSDDAIVSSLTRLDLEKRIYPQLEVSNQFVLKFGCPIRKDGTNSAILEPTSHRFTYTVDDVTVDKCFLVEDDGDIHVAYRTSSGVTVFQTNVGTIDVNTGLLTLTNFSPDTIENDEIDVRIRVTPRVNDFVPRLNQLFTIDASDIQVQLLSDTTATFGDQVTFFNGGILP